MSTIVREPKQGFVTSPDGKKYALLVDHDVKYLQIKRLANLKDDSVLDLPLRSNTGPCLIQKSESMDSDGNIIDSEYIVVYLGMPSERKPGKSKGSLVLAGKSKPAFKAIFRNTHPEIWEELIPELEMLEEIAVKEGSTLNNVLRFKSVDAPTIPMYYAQLETEQHFKLMIPDPKNAGKFIPRISFNGKPALAKRSPFYYFEDENPDSIANGKINQLTKQGAWVEQLTTEEDANATKEAEVTAP